MTCISVFSPPDHTVLSNLFQAISQARLCISDRSIPGIGILSKYVSNQQDASREVWDHLLCQQAERVHHTLIGELATGVHV
jgi:hypothetical protein